MDTPQGTFYRVYFDIYLTLDGSEFNAWEPEKGHYKAYNLGKGKGLSVLDILEAMRKATGFDYKYEIIGPWPAARGHALAFTPRHK